MPTLSPSGVLAASGFVAAELASSKRRSLAALAALWKVADPDDIAGSLSVVLPLIVQVMHAQQAAGRVSAWSQAQLAAGVATGAEPGTITLPISSDRDGRMLSGRTFESVIAPTVPGTLARIGAGAAPGTALQLSQQLVASMVGSVAHDEARATTADVVLRDSGPATSVQGYARRTEGAYTCDFCRMLATRGPVYREDTASFRAHAFCDCTVYAVSMESFTVDPGDWDAYQRWAGRTSEGAASRGATAPRPTSTGGISLDQFRATAPPRLTAVEAQIASYEPVIASGNATQWMREQLPRLYAERDALLAAA